MPVLHLAQTFPLYFHVEWLYTALTRIFTCVCFFLFIDARLFAMESYQWNHVEVRLTSQRKIEEKEKKNYPKYWKKACKQIGRSLIGEGSLYDYRMAKTYSCYDGQNPSAVIAGKESPPEPSWLLQVIDGDDNFTINAYYVAPETARIDLRSLPKQAFLQLTANSKTMRALADPVVSKLVAMSVMDQIPVSRPLGKLDEKGGISYTPEEKTLVNLPVPSPQLNVITLAYDKKYKIWLPRLMGKLTLVEGPEEIAKKDEAKNKKTEPPAAAHAYRWKFDQAVNLDAAYGEDLWLVDARGRGGQQAAIDEKLSSVLKKYGLNLDFLSDILFATLSKGYLGMRMGRNLLSGNPLLAKATMVGILAEVRSGPLQGLRWYWDFGPKDHVNDGGYNTDFTWSRPTVGWSFGKNLNWGLINRIDVVPKIGLVDLDASLAVTTTNGDKLPLRYRVKNAINLGAELGIERSTPWFLARAWGASDLANFGVSIGKDAISSYRGGMDTYWEMGNITATMKLALIVFGFGEMIKLEKLHTDVQTTADSSNAQITSLSYTMVFAGLGMTLVW